jgi:streptogrisin D
MRRSTTRRSALAVTAMAVLAGVLTVPQAALAVPVPLTDSSGVNALATDLGADRTGGVYRDESGRLVIAVTDEATADAVEAAGGVAEVVTYSTARLRSIHDTLDAKIADVAPIPNTAWGIDPRTNQVAVEIFEGVPAADEKRLMDLISGYGDAVTVNRRSGNVTTQAYETHGGTGVHSEYGPPGHNCTLGFNVRDSAGQKYFLTAGHCAKFDNDVFWHRNQGNVYLGKRIWQDFGGIEKDFAVMAYVNDDVAAYGAVNAFGVDYDINYSRYPDAGDPVHRSGQRSSDLVGEVLSPSVTVTMYDPEVGNVLLKNMIMTDLCSRGSDSGGPLWNGTGAIGILSGGNGPNDDNCRSQTNNELSFYQPVHWIMARYGLEAF